MDCASEDIVSRVQPQRVVLCLLSSTFKFDCINESNLEEFDCGGHRLLSRDFICAKRHVAYEKWTAGAPGHCLAVHEHHVQGQWKGSVMSMNYHPRRISNQQNIDSCFVHLFTSLLYSALLAASITTRVQN
jgi:hypothetical protein